MRKTWSTECGLVILGGWLLLTAYMFTTMPLDRLMSLEAVYNNLTMVVLPVVFGALGFKRHVEGRNVQHHP